MVGVCRACYGVLRFIMESGAKGCEVIVSGKLRAQRAKAMKFKDGFMVSSGEPARQYIDSAVRHVMLRQGVLGIKVNDSSALTAMPVSPVSGAGGRDDKAAPLCLQVKIMKEWDPSGKQGPSIPLPDIVTIHEPKDNEEFGFEDEKDKFNKVKEIDGDYAKTEVAFQEQQQQQQQTLA